MAWPAARPSHHPERLMADVEHCVTPNSPLLGRGLIPMPLAFIIDQLAAAGDARIKPTLASHGARLCLGSWLSQPRANGRPQRMPTIVRCGWDSQLPAHRRHDLLAKKALLMAHASHTRWAVPPERGKEAGSSARQRRACIGSDGHTPCRRSWRHTRCSTRRCCTPLHGGGTGGDGTRGTTGVLRIPLCDRRE